jgi:DNA-binding CsgD family transcriptional regulator
MSKPHNRGGHVQAGYALGRDDTGLTARERQVLDLLYRKRTPLEIQADLCLTKQRVYAIIASIKRKGRQLPGR